LPTTHSVVKLKPPDLKAGSAGEKEKQKSFSVGMLGRPKSVSIDIGKQRFRCLVDTGAEVSVIHERVFRQIKGLVLKRSNMSILSATGSSLKVAGTTVINFKLGKKEFKHEFVVVSNLNRTFILGKDWLESQGAILYFNLMKLKVDGQ
jgi:predicted aspartyl protease